MYPVDQRIDVGRSSMGKTTGRSSTRVSRDHALALGCVFMMRCLKAGGPAGGLSSVAFVRLFSRLFVFCRDILAFGCAINCSYCRYVYFVAGLTRLGECFHTF